MSDLTMSPAPPASRAALWTGRTITGLVTLFFIMDAGMKIAGLAVVGETAATLGWTADAGFWRGMGLLLLAITALHAWPRTAILGAVLLTGYLGGAIATHLRIGSPLLSHTLFSIYLGVALWGGLWLREPRVRQWLPMAR